MEKGRFIGKLAAAGLLTATIGSAVISHNRSEQVPTPMSINNLRKSLADCDNVGKKIVIDGRLANSSAVVEWLSYAPYLHPAININPRLPIEINQGDIYNVFPEDSDSDRDKVSVIEQTNKTWAITNIQRTQLSVGYAQNSTPSSEISRIEGEIVKLAPNQLQPLNCGLLVDKIEPKK